MTEKTTPLCPCCKTPITIKVNRTERWAECPNCGWAELFDYPAERDPRPQGPRRRRDGY